MTADRRRTSTAKKATAEEEPAEQAPEKTEPAKKTTAKKTTAKKATPKKAPAKKSSPAPRAESRPRASAVQVAGTAAEQLAMLTGKGVEGITGVELTDDGWRVSVEVLELRRIPDSTDVLGLYEVDADEKGNLQGYRRLHRYARGAAGEV